MISWFLSTIFILPQDIISGHVEFTPSRVSAVLAARRGPMQNSAGGLNVVALLNIILKLKGGRTAGMILSEKQDLWSQLTNFE